MIFDVDLQKLKFNAGRLSSKETIGSWNTDDTDNFKLNPGKSLGNMAATTVYRIVTVIVSMRKLEIHCDLLIFYYFLKIATAIYDEEYR